jgi:hypothetical protein
MMEHLLDAEVYSKIVTVSVDMHIFGISELVCHIFGLWRSVLEVL